ncbi:hypothetical protein HPB52_004562 [Rhipicephalus sanguineus]|uniref:Nucleic-acid-binding protein from mobile element jockey n=1 Tax=Rhipicephalus sanguineus TaxID=34632 RepID=A0A9D4PVF7_RHISA|nr:hypothetical protein HPB52_004562 [Rhipicephalus sanguineus]
MECSPECPNTLASTAVERNRITQSNNAASADGTQASKTESTPSVPSTLGDTAVMRLRSKRLPQLPVDDFKIVFRLSAGVNLAQYNDGELRTAVVANSGLHPATKLPTMPKYENSRWHFTLNLAFHAYIAPPDGARPGIIYRAWNGESPQDLLRELRRANPLLPIVQGTWGELPPSLKMFGILYAVFNFRPKVEACLNCRQVGHRRDVCHLPNRLTCSSCGQKHPEDHPCTPQCVICGDAHMTGDRACKQRFQRGYSRPLRPRQRPQQEQEQHEFKLEKESFPSIQDGNRGSKSPGRNSGSKGKSPGRSSSQSRDLDTKSGKLRF